jgi:hypothetical protein
VEYNEQRLHGGCVVRSADNQIIAWKGIQMRRTATFVVAAICGLSLARAQDIAGLEDCSKTTGLDKRTGCFQSNVEYLNRAITKGILDLQQKLNAANAEIGKLKEALAAVQKKVDDLQNAAKKPESKH